MPYEPLHHKYRPQSFAELVGQEAIATTLTNALRRQKIAPAYLFTGARGTGKTSSARILAKSLNCQKSDVPTEQPCGVCEVCRSIANGSAMDVIEIDAASNTGVDNIRELIERAQFAPVQCRYKVYVLDEVHMLTGQAFNALLKTLEEPPPRVVFVLATTDPQRVLSTIISRCQRFDFRRIELSAMVQHLSSIAQKESIDIAVDAIQLVAQISQGGLRDAESLLDQLSLLEGQITVERVWDLVGAVPERDLLALVQAIASDDGVAVLDRARHLMDRGREPLIVLQNLASFYRDLLIAKTSPERNDLVAITAPTWSELCAFVQPLDLSVILYGQQHLRASEVQVKNTTQPRLWLEVTLLGLLPASIQQLMGIRDQVSVTHSEIRAVARPVGPVSRPEPILPKPEVPSVSVAPPPITPPVESTPEIESIPEPPREPAIHQNGSSGSTTPSVEEPISQPIAVPSKSGLGDTAQVPVSNSKAVEPHVDLAEIWEQVLSQVQPYSTQIMLRQQCQLVGLTEQEARIGARSQKLFKMAKDRLPNIEAAFAKLYPQKIVVSLEVLARSGLETESQPPATPPLYPPSSPQPAPPVRESAPSPHLPTPVTPFDAPVTAAKAANSAPVTAKPEVLPEPILPASWEVEDDVTRAARSLAQLFNGQIVNWESDLTIGSASDAVIDQPELEVVDSDPDHDVPF